MEVLSLELAGLWTQWIGPILLFVIGLGLVVFVHELGHFLMAKKVDIKVERFALGFGPRLFGFRKGETDYRVNLIPLGGYIKMLGQEDFAPLKDRGQLDPRSYEAKTVGRRLAVIAAGVAMNVVFAAVLFVIVGLVGKQFSAPVIGGVVPGYPADTVELRWQTAEPATQPTSAATMCPSFPPGLRPGDEVLTLDGKKLTRYQDLQMAAVLAREGERFGITVRRKDDRGREWIGTGEIGVRKNPEGTMPIFGIAAAADVVFDERDNALVDSPFRKGDRLASIAGQPIEHAWQIDGVEEHLDGRPVTVAVDRPTGGGSTERIDFTVQPSLRTKDDVAWLPDGTRGKVVATRVQDRKAFFRVRLPDGAEREIAEDDLAGGAAVEHLDVLGMVPRLKVEAVEKGSPATAKGAGILPGDILLNYGDHPEPTFRQFLKISGKVRGQDTQIVVLRDGERKALLVRPKERKGQALVGITPGLDLLHPVVAGVREGSPAAQAGLLGGDVIEKINGRPVESWIDIVNILNGLTARDVRIVYRRNAQEGTADLGRLTPDVFASDDYVVHVFPVEVFAPLMVTIRQGNPLKAIGWGAGETWNFVISAYATLRALIRGTVSPETLSGPVGIGGLAIKVGRNLPLIDFVYLMAFISATIAVINFLPVPVVDGGHAAFLIVEKIRGKPLPVKVLNIAQLVGLALILLVFVLLTWQDIGRILEGMW